MARSSRVIESAIGLALVAGPVLAQEPERGRLLYENNCLTCHYERIHNRDASKSLVQSHAQLRLQVARWAQQVKQPLKPEDLDDIAEYLDRSHYKLAK
jgi:mono/diheme cytochrome c family protein